MPFLSARANLGIRLEVDDSSESGRGAVDKNTSYPWVVLARNQVPVPDKNDFRLISSNTVVFFFGICSRDVTLQIKSV